MANEVTMSMEKNYQSAGTAGNAGEYKPTSFGTL